MPPSNLSTKTKTISTTKTKKPENTMMCYTILKNGKCKRTNEVNLKLENTNLKNCCLLGMIFVQGLLRNP
jgi:hypothetical protein